jgi:hypothetical protein
VKFITREREAEKLMNLFKPNAATARATNRAIAERKM